MKELKQFEEHSPGTEFQTSLEHKLVEQYLRGKGYRLADLQHLPVERAQELMREACTYAALKLAEIESRARFREKIELPETVH